MTFAEILFFFIFLYGAYRLLGPIQRKLETWIYLRLKSNQPGAQKPVINIKDYEKK